MAIKLDNALATSELINSLERVRRGLGSSCPIASAVDTVFNGKKCLTYQYILLTALVAKATNPNIDMLSMQMDDPSNGAYSPRQLCKEVVYPFQKSMLSDVMDGANNDPLVNKPARFLRLDKSNQARGDGKRALCALCDALPSIKSQDAARKCLDYIMARLVRQSDELARREAELKTSLMDCSTEDARVFLSDLLDQGFGGDALTLVASALYRIQYPRTSGFEVIPHPVNQPGSSSRQLSDLDLRKNGEPFLATELKDKPFTVDDVRRAAQTALAGGAPSILFVSGRGGSLLEQTQGYFSSVRSEYANKGIYVGLCDVDALMDMILSTHADLDAALLMNGVYDQARANASTPETLLWVYQRLTSK